MFFQSNEKILCRIQIEMRLFLRDAETSPLLFLKCVYFASINNKILYLNFQVQLEGECISKWKNYSLLALDPLNYSRLRMVQLNYVLYVASGSTKLLFVGIGSTKLIAIANGSAKLCTLCFQWFH